MLVVARDVYGRRRNVSRHVRPPNAHDSHVGFDVHKFVSIVNVSTL